MTQQSITENPWKDISTEAIQTYISAIGNNLSMWNRPETAREYLLACEELQSR